MTEQEAIEVSNQELTKENREKKKKEKPKLDLNEVKRYLTELADPFKRFIRGIHGESPEDDIFNGLIKVQDDRERARLTLQQGQANAFRELLAKIGGEEWQIMKEVAIMKNIYSVGSCDGEQWKDAILMVHARQPTMTPISLTTPQIQPSQPQAKKHFWQRIKQEEQKPQIA